MWETAIWVFLRERLSCHKIITLQAVSSFSYLLKRGEKVRTQDEPTERRSRDTRESPLPILSSFSPLICLIINQLACSMHWNDCSHSTRSLSCTIEIYHLLISLNCIKQTPNIQRNIRTCSLQQWNITQFSLNGVQMTNGTEDSKKVKRKDITPEGPLDIGQAIRVKFGRKRYDAVAVQSWKLYSSKQF